MPKLADDSWTAPAGYKVRLPMARAALVDPFFDDLTLAQKYPEHKYLDDTKPAQPFNAAISGRVPD